MNWKTEPEPTWEEWCLRYRDTVLTGKYAHCCSDWDDLPVDETCIEFDSCHCTIVDEKGNVIPKVQIICECCGRTKAECNEEKMQIWEHNHQQEED